MDTPASYVNLGFISISVPNLALIAGMVVPFVLPLGAPLGCGAARPGVGAMRLVAILPRVR